MKHPHDVETDGHARSRARSRVAAGTAAAAAFTLAAVAAEARADVISLAANGGWTEFTFGGAGSSWEQSFTFRSTTPFRLLVTDGWQAGDEFSIRVADTGGGPAVDLFTSDVQQPLPFARSPIPNCLDDYDTAFGDPRWSSGSFLLGPGTYSITGSVTEMPFDPDYGGNGALRIQSVAVPLPAAAWLGLGGLGAVVGLAIRRRRRGSAELA